MFCVTASFKYNQFTVLFTSALSLIADIGFNEGARTRLLYKSSIFFLGDSFRSNYAADSFNNSYFNLFLVVLADQFMRARRRGFI